MKNLKTLQKEINKAKNKLQKKLNKGIIYENFGIDEARVIHNEYSIYAQNVEWKSVDERNYGQKLIHDFLDWCGNATPVF